MDVTSSSESLNQSQSPSHLSVSKELHDFAHLHFPKFKHEHPPVRNVNEIVDEKLTIGQKVADAVAANMGSWRFIIIQSIILATWIVLNTMALIHHWDPYPFILLNLMLSFQAAYAAPFIMISQNRQAEKDRLTAQNDYLTDMKGEEETRHMMEHLDHQDALTLEIVQRLEAQNERLTGQEKLILEVVQRLEEQNARMKGQHEEMMAHLRRLDPTLAQKLEGDVQQK
ncbi:MAG TPA: DUF1003 domain-containing protein [Ktedonobacteraceae bacterium]|nr:DUF1003 domain-containing protein [Ktedonobacteraceae bacterium]